jgi:hypothetical protein
MSYPPVGPTTACIAARPATTAASASTTFSSTLPAAARQRPVREARAETPQRPAGHEVARHRADEAARADE